MVADSSDVMEMDIDDPDVVDGPAGHEPWVMPPSASATDDPLLSCLVELLAFLGHPHSRAALIAGLPLDRERLTPALAVRALERAGFVASLYRRSLDDIPAPTLPCILFLSDGSACVLLERRSNGELAVAFPETGRGVVELNQAELGTQHNGYVLFAKPAFRPDKTAMSSGATKQRNWFWGTIADAWPIYAEVILAALAINLFALASPLFIMNVYDRVVPNQALETLWALSLGVTTVFLFDFLLRTLRGYFLDAAGKAADIKLASHIFEQVLGIRMAARPGSAGAFANNLREFETLRDFFTSATLIAVIDLPFIVLFLTIVWLIGGPLALVPAVSVPVVLLTGLLLQGPLQRISQRTFKEAAQKHGLLVESISGLETIKSLGAEGQIQRRWENFVGATATSATKARFFAALGVNVAALAQNLTTVGVVIFGVHLIGEGALTVGALVACTIITGRAMAPLAQVAGILTRYHQARAAFRALSTVMAMPIERPPQMRFLHRSTFEGHITFKGVSFAYPGERVQALEDVSFRIDAGERVGVIGKVGSGKTTIEKLLLGFYEPDQGTVLIDGIDLRQIDPSDLRRNIGTALQDAVLFDGTLRDNICLGAAYADDDLILRAASIAGVDGFAHRHPLGFDAAVGERGSQLSGGQRQAVALARAFLQDPPILLLDEPTSAMDNSAENRFKEQLAGILDKKTLVLVTHRTSLLSIVDRLIVMDGGRLVADGPKNDVLRALASGDIRGGG